MCTYIYRGHSYSRAYLPAQWSDGDHIGRGHVWSCSPRTLAAVIDRNSSTLSPWDNLWSGETACARCSPLDVPFPLALENKILIIENEHVSYILSEKSSWGTWSSRQKATIFRCLRSRDPAWTSLDKVYVPPAVRNSGTDTHEIQDGYPRELSYSDHNMVKTCTFVPSYIRSCTVRALSNLLSCEWR